MIRCFTLHDDRTLILFVFASPDASLPATLARQKALLCDVYDHGGWAIAGSALAKRASRVSSGIFVHQQT
jgi:hypothetical protein